MNVLAIYFANEHTKSRIDQSIEWNLAHAIPAGPSLRDRVASAVAGLRRLVEIPASSAGIPPLKDYPYRS